MKWLGLKLPNCTKDSSTEHNKANTLKNTSPKTKHAVQANNNKNNMYSLSVFFVLITETIKKTVPPGKSQNLVLIFSSGKQNNIHLSFTNSSVQFKKKQNMFHRVIDSPELPVFSQVQSDLDALLIEINGFQKTNVES